MNSQDHKISATSTGHGVHLCHRCGWPFPNPHPSSKQRRHHKRVCGTIEGYKIIHSDHLVVSDDEHASDEDEHTPDPRAVKKNTEEIGSSGGVGWKSNRSEDDVYSDAVTEFSDSGISPRLEERFESVSTNVDKNTEQKSLEVPITDTSAEAATSVGHVNGLHPDVIKSEILKDVVVDSTNEYGDGGVLEGQVKATLDSEEGKVSDLAPTADESKENLHNTFVPEDDQITRAFEKDDVVHSEEVSDSKLLETSKMEGAPLEVQQVLDSTMPSDNSTDFPSSCEADSDAIHLQELSKTESRGNDFDKPSQGLGTDKVNVGASKSVVIVSSEEPTCDVNVVTSDECLKEPVPSPSDVQILHETSDTVDDKNVINVEDVSGVNSKSLQDEASLISRSDSLDANCGSVSAVSSQSNIAVADTNSQSPDALETNSQMHKTTTEDKSDVFEPPSFMTLVQSGGEGNQALQAGWFPSITNVLNESEGRKKNEEIIAKVTKQHNPLKSLLNEVKSPNTKQVPAENQKEDEIKHKDNGDGVTTVSSVLNSEVPKDQDNNKDMEEWNSPARYPVEIKKEKKKKAKSYWVPFVCCSSVHRDL
ncbi:hypothetical protein DH2020_005042 [Rehmannia glutinosa]|uniref:C2H2-type domain-containing protein n=1 Tax=Rehmannia glutinosa TaxID=99300 RepID=A0ABR0XR52_REHGL